MDHSKRTPRLRDLLSAASRRDALSETGFLAASDWDPLARMTLAEWTAHLDDAIENVVATFPMPIGVATNFLVNGVERAVPMVTEERTIVAGASKAAKLARPSGFRVKVSDPMIRGHVLFTDIGGDPGAFARMASAPLAVVVEDIKREGAAGRRSGFLKEAWAEGLSHPTRGAMLKVVLLADAGETMGANAVTRIAGRIAERLGAEFGLKRGVSICCNDVPERTAKAVAFWRPGPGLTAGQLERVLDLQAWAEADPSRAVTHNKGVMNGVDAVCQATGQDVRAIEAGAAADAYRTGACRPLTAYERLPRGGVAGTLSLQLCVASAGGATAHPMAAFCRALMRADRSADVAAVIAAAGLAQNFAALLSLASEGILSAHERLGRKK